MRLGSRAPAVASAHTQPQVGVGVSQQSWRFSVLPARDDTELYCTLGAPTLSLSWRRAETGSSGSSRSSRGPWRPRRRPTRCPSARGGPTCSPTSAVRCSAHNRVPLHGAEVEELKSTLPVNFATAASEPASRPPPAVPCLVTAAATRVRRVQAILATSTAWTARTARAAPGCHAVR